MQCCLMRAGETRGTGCGLPLVVSVAGGGSEGMSMWWNRLCFFNDCQGQVSLTGETQSVLYIYKIIIVAVFFLDNT